jgi:branched-chain amino acid transport system permease protein
MLQYVLAGLALGSIYAIASASLVVTFESAGVLNFSFASMAFVVARFYYWLNSQHGWRTDTAGIVSLVVVAPLLGVVLYALLFRFLRGKSTLTKIAATIGLSVALPVVSDLIFGEETVTSAPGFASLGDKPLHFLGAPVTTDQLIAYGFLLFVVITGTVILRRTNVGLRVRAVVDSEALASLSGTNPGRVAVGVWAASAALAGLAGILAAPSFTLTVAGMTKLMAAAFAAVVVARLRSLPVAVATSLAMGVVTDVIQKYHQNGTFTAAIVPSVPFGFMLVALIVYAVRFGPTAGQEEAAPLDRAVRPAHHDAQQLADGPETRNPIGMALGLAPLAVVAVLPLIFRGSSYWMAAVALGFCYAITFLSFTVVTGEGGMLWLSQIIFAGIGALATAQFVTHWHVPVLLAIVLAAVLAAAVGAAIGLLTIRLGDLYVALGTLTFGLLVEGLIFTRERFLQGGLGVFVDRPHFATDDFAFAYLALVVFGIFAIFTVNLRRSTSGLALRAVRDSEQASRTLGLSVLQVKVIVGALAAFTAAVGGGFLAMYANVAQPQSYETFLGLVWLAVVVTMGVRSISAAVLSGLALSLLPAVFDTYLPTRLGEVPAALFGLGAISVARHPEGVVAQQGRALRNLLSRSVPRRSAAAEATP